MISFAYLFAVGMNYMRVALHLALKVKKKNASSDQNSVVYLRRPTTQGVDDLTKVKAGFNREDETLYSAVYQ